MVSQHAVHPSQAALRLQELRGVPASYQPHIHLMRSCCGKKAVEHLHVQCVCVCVVRFIGMMPAQHTLCVAAEHAVVPQ